MKYLLSIIILIQLTSCHQRVRENRFQKQLSHFDKIIINHFPNKICDKYASSIFNDVQKDVTSIILLNQYSDNAVFEKVKDSLIELSKAKYNSKDSCLLVVNMYSNEKNYFNSFKTYNESYLKKECLNDKMPIANFWPLDFKCENITNLPDTYNIYVFDAKNKIINKQYMSKNVYMPDYWKHGFSNGVAINNKSNDIIYWFVIW